MSLAEPSPLELFTLQIHKNLTTNPEQTWVNTYEIQASGDSPTYAELSACADRIVAFEANIHFDVVQFDHYVLSTFVPDGQPYNPASFTSVPLNTFGTRAVGDDMLALTICFYMRRNVQFGRDGRLFYRGVLQESNVSAPAGDWVLDDPALFDTQVVQPAVAASDIDLHYFVGAAPTKLVMASTTTDNVRVIGSLVTAGVAEKPLNNKYFRKTPSGNQPA